MTALIISNIAWEAAEDAAIADLLATQGIDAIEVAPTRLFADPAHAKPEEIAAAKAWWNSRGIRFAAMQALLFGRPELQLFGSGDSRQEMAQHLGAIIRLAGALGCGPLVFGSPRNRVRGALPYAEACTRAAEFFRPLAALAAQEGCRIVIEPNAVAYGCDFITTVEEASAFAQQVDHPGFGWHLDCGVFALEKDSLAAVERATLPSHMHLSAPQLAPVDAREGCIPSLIAAMLQKGYAGYFSIEMKKSERGNVENVAAALCHARQAIEEVRRAG